MPVHFPRRAALVAAFALAAPRVRAQARSGPYDLPPLPYGYDALEPVIDRETMELHHGRHHRTYVETLNRLLASHQDLHGMSIEELLSRIEQVPAEIRDGVRNNGGGHANHQLFWKVMRPGASAREPVGLLAQEINRTFGGYEGFRERFEDAAEARFGSGWVWLVTDPRGQNLEIVTTANQDSVLLPSIGKPALLGNDLWEHAYYLKHRNRRAEYVKAWWQVVNWSYVNERLELIRAGRMDQLGGPAR